MKTEAASHPLSLTYSKRHISSYVPSYCILTSIILRSVFSQLSKTMPNPPSEADIIFNRASVALANSQRLIASWLPPPTASELANAKSEEDVEREEQEMFTPVPEV